MIIRMRKKNFLKIKIYGNFLIEWVSKEDIQIERKAIYTFKSAIAKNGIKTEFFSR